ncbi:MAG: hypothetical protein C4B57_11100 [Deltaproteobacteria bacterium]|nr:MAG: hypothetical protein C4B57_11100 [Deltaproteobacteria bacterium]
MAAGYFVQEILPEGDTKLAACLLETGEGIPRSTAKIVAGRTADLAPFDILADVVFAQVVM